MESSLEAFGAGADGYLIKSQVTLYRIVEEVNKFFNKEEEYPTLSN